MLKRNDLSKQFELVVQQEIKNFQDASYQINQTLNDLGSKIEQLEKTTSNNHALLEARHKSLSIELEILRTSYEKTHKRLDSHVNDTNSTLTGLEENLGFNVKYSIAAHDNNTHAMTEINSLRESLKAMQDQLNTQTTNTNSYLDQFQFHIKSHIANVKKEIIERPSDSEAVRKEFSEKLACHKVDVEGITKEFKVNRKEFMVIEKKLESIYTLIDDIKKAEATS